jgi:hypothetical protein
VIGGGGVDGLTGLYEAFDPPHPINAWAHITKIVHAAIRVFMDVSTFPTKGQDRNQLQLIAGFHGSNMPAGLFAQIHACSSRCQGMPGKCPA